MKIKTFNNLVKHNSSEKILKEYMEGKHGKLTDKQLQKICDNGCGHGGVFVAGKQDQMPQRKQGIHVIYDRYILGQWDKQADEVEKVTGKHYTGYDQETMIDDLLNLVDELKSDKEYLQDQIRDIKQDMEDNYQAIPKEAQYE